MFEELDRLFPGFTFDRDILIAGGLCHDIGKVWEFDPENVDRWRADPSATGFRSIRHPGLHLPHPKLPEPVAHIAGGHSGEGELLTRSLENTIIRWADHSFWKIVEAGGQLNEVDKWLPSPKVAEPMQGSALSASHVSFKKESWHLSALILSVLHSSHFSRLSWIGSFQEIDKTA